MFYAQYVACYFFILIAMFYYERRKTKMARRGKKIIHFIKKIAWEYLTSLWHVSPQQMEKSNQKRLGVRCWCLIMQANNKHEKIGNRKQLKSERGEESNPSKEFRCFISAFARTIIISFWQKLIHSSVKRLRQKKVFCFIIKHSSMWKICQLPSRADAWSRFSLSTMTPRKHSAFSSRFNKFIKHVRKMKILFSTWHLGNFKKHDGILCIRFDTWLCAVFSFSHRCLPLSVMMLQRSPSNGKKYRKITWNT